MATDDRHIGRFRDEAARQRLFAAYDNALAAWPTPPNQLDVETRFGTTHVLSKGASSGAPIVLLHGLAVSSASWFASIRALSASHPVYAVDAIGDAGRSTQTSRVRDGADMAWWLDDVLGALDLHGAHLVGLSYGGWLALNQARRAPDRLAGVTAVDPVGAIGRPQLRFLVRIVPDSLLASLGKSDRALVRLMQLLNNGTAPDEPLRELSIAGLRTYRGKLPSPKRMSDDDLRAIRTRTQLLFCDRSPVNSAQRAAQRSRDLIPNATVEIIRDAGHMLPVEKPQVFATRVLDFVSQSD